MVTIAIVSGLAGAALGMRYKVFVLVPATMLAVGIVAAFCLANDVSLWSTVGAITLVATSLELGYFGGSFTSFALTSARCSQSGGHVMPIRTIWRSRA